MIDDGYTDTVQGIEYRPLLDWRKRWVAERIRRGDWVEVQNLLFGRRVLSDSEKSLILTAAMSYREDGDLKNLRWFLELVRDEPLLALRTCSLCRRYWFDEELRKIVTRDGVPLERPRQAKVICETHAGCPKGHWATERRLSERNKRAIWHYCEYRYVGCPDPEDDIVRRNWNLIRATVGTHDLARYCERTD